MFHSLYGQNVTPVVICLVLMNYTVFGKLQQQLLCARISELNSGFGIIAGSLEFRDGADSETLMLNNRPFR